MKQLSFVILLAVVVSGAHADIAKFEPPDKRLDKKITLEVDHVKLEDVAKSLSEQSGITIKAGTGDRDWKVREQHVTIRAKDLPAGRMIDEITKLDGFYVSREGKAGEWTYIIWQDKKSRDREAELLQAEKDEAARKSKETRKSTEDAAKKALNMTPEEAAKLRDKDPIAAYLGGTKSGKAFAQMLSSMDSYLPGYSEGKRSFAPISGFPPGMQRSVSDMMNSGIAKTFGDNGANQNLSPDKFGYVPLGDTGDRGAALSMDGLMFVTGVPNDGSPGSGQGPFGIGRPMVMFPIMRTDSPFGKFVGQAMLALEDGVPIQDVQEQFTKKVEDPRFLGEAMAKESKTEKETPTDPELTREVELKDIPAPKDIAALVASASKAEEHGKTVAALSSALGMPVLLESFDRLMPLSVFLTPGKQPVYKIMIALEKAGYSWELENKSLRIRPKNWATRRSHEIPESFIAFYKDLLEKQDEFTLDDLANMANSLTNEQIRNTLTVNGDLNFAVRALMGGEMQGSVDVLRLYASLTPRQKEALDSEAGLAFGDLSDTQWARMNQIISAKLGAGRVTGGSMQIVPLTEEQSKANWRSRIFRLTARMSDEQETRKADVSVSIQSKEAISAFLEQRKKAQETAQKAAEQKSAAQTPPPEQPK